MLSSFLSYFPTFGEEAPIEGTGLMGAAARQAPCIDLPVGATRWSFPGASSALFVGRLILLGNGTVGMLSRSTQPQMEPVLAGCCSQLGLSVFISPSEGDHFLLMSHTVALMACHCSQSVDCENTVAPLVKPVFFVQIMPLVTSCKIFQFLWNVNFCFSVGSRQTHTYTVARSLQPLVSPSPLFGCLLFIIGELCHVTKLVVTHFVVRRKRNAEASVA